MIVMWHKFIYKLDGAFHELHSSMVCLGENQRNTAMAKCVGLPLGIATKLILEGKIKTTGVQLPIDEAIYQPVLDSLKNEGIVFNENIPDGVDKTLY
jgi:saccharopine dehydrogenase-like NADP-dependent oxidoreductase